MLKQWIYDKGAVIGTYTMEVCGLYLTFTCEILEGKEKIRRLYAVSGFDSHYLGIPDPGGRLQKKISRKILREPVSCLASSEAGRSRWSPWRGSVDGVNVNDALVCSGAGEVLLSLNPEEALQFPAWVGEFQEINDQHGVRMLVQLTSDGQLPAKEIKNRREKDEKDENSVRLIDPQLSFDSDPCAGECTGDEEDRRQADRSDL